MNRTIWEVSRGSGGFKGMYESLKVVRQGPNDYLVKFVSVGGSKDLQSYPKIRDAIRAAALTAEERGFDVSKARTDEHLYEEDIPSDFDFRGGTL